MNESQSSETGKDADIVKAIVNCRNESEAARTERMAQNRLNFEMYNNKQNYAHKKAGQSQEFLPKQSMAVEQLTSFIHQGLVDLTEWFSVDPEDGNKKPILTRDEARKLVMRQLQKAGFYTFIQDAVKSGLLGSLMIVKVHGHQVQKPLFYTEKKRSFLGFKRELRKRKKEVWELRVDLVRQRNYFPDPTGDGLYEQEQLEIDHWKLLKIAEANPEDYDVELIRGLASYTDKIEEQRKNEEINQTPTSSDFRKRIKVTEHWGAILDADGGLLHENAVCAIANDQFLIRPPKPNPFWHGKSPYVVAPIIRVPHSIWHKALMDASTFLNKAMNELYNLILDSGIMAVYGIKQVREHWLDDPEEISNGIPPGTTLRVNMACPPGQKAMEQIATGGLSQEAVNVFNLTNAEHQAAALTNDLRMGVLPSRQVKATEVVESSQSITSVFTGVAKAIESDLIEKILDLAFMTIMQHADDWDTDEVEALLGESKAKELKALSAEERFEKTINGHRFKVFGITQTLNKIKDFRKLTSLLQTISASPTLMEEFNKKYDFGKLLGEIMRALDVNEDRIKLDETDGIMTAIGEGGQAPGADAVSMPNEQSQTPQVASGEAGSDAPISAIPHTTFPRNYGSGG